MRTHQPTTGVSQQGDLTFPVRGLGPLVGDERTRADAYLDLAADQARHATCLRSLCGAVVVTAAGEVVGLGSNSLPGVRAPHTCLKETGALAPGFKSDRSCCVHAEVRAIVSAMRSGAPVEGASVYFTRVDALTGGRVASGRPYCTICSKFALEVGLSGFVLAHSFGIVIYPTELYNSLSFTYGH